MRGYPKARHKYIRHRNISKALQPIGPRLSGRFVWHVALRILGIALTLFFGVRGIVGARGFWTVTLLVCCVTLVVFLLVKGIKKELDCNVESRWEKP